MNCGGGGKCHEVSSIFLDSALLASISFLLKVVRAVYLFVHSQFLLYHNHWHTISGLFKSYCSRPWSAYGLPQTRSFLFTAFYLSISAALRHGPKRASSMSPSLMLSILRWLLSQWFLIDMFASIIAQRRLYALCVFLSPVNEASHVNIPHKGFCHEGTAFKSLTRVYYSGEKRNDHISIVGVRCLEHLNRPVLAEASSKSLILVSFGKINMWLTSSWHVFSTWQEHIQSMMYRLSYWHWCTRNSRGYS